MLYLLVTHIDSYGLNGLIWTHMDPWIDSMQKVFYFTYSRHQLLQLCCLGNSWDFHLLKSTKMCVDMQLYHPYLSLHYLWDPFGAICIWTDPIEDLSSALSHCRLQHNSSQLTAVVALSFLSADGRRKTLRNIACN